MDVAGAETDGSRPNTLRGRAAPSPRLVVCSDLETESSVETTGLTVEPPHKKRKTVQVHVPLECAGNVYKMPFYTDCTVQSTFQSTFQCNALFVKDECLIKQRSIKPMSLLKIKKGTTIMKHARSHMSPLSGELLGHPPTMGRRRGPVASLQLAAGRGHRSRISPSAIAQCVASSGADIGLLSQELRDCGAPGPLEGTAAPQVTSPLSENPLAQCVHKWKQCGASPWVLRTVTTGYRLQFAQPPPKFERIIYSQAKGQAAEVLRAEILELLAKGAIREVPSDLQQRGFYSRYFLIKKRGGGLRPILDLRALNKYLKTFNFKMLTAATLLRSLRQGDWYTSIDLKDAYFHIPIYPPHRKFLRFGFEGKTFEYMVLPFGLSLAPRVFVKITQAAIAPLRHQGVRIATYIDDWLLSAESASEAIIHTRLVVDMLSSLGFTINYTKSVMVPTQSINYIGIALDSLSFTARLSQERVDSFLQCVTLFKIGRKVPFSTCLRMAGLIASAISLVRLGRLNMRPFQIWMRSLRIPTHCRHRTVTVTAGCVLALRWWGNRNTLTEGVPMGIVTSRKVVTTDASLSGWGATLDGMVARGVWDEGLKTAHINYLELMAVFLALCHFKPFVQGRHVLVRSDNTTTIFYVNKQGGVKSRSLHLLAHRLIMWCDKHLLSVRACYVPGLLNAGADLLSRGQLRYADWSLHPEVAAQLWVRFGRAEVDLFASEENTKCRLFFSMKGTPSLGLDALSHVWPRGLLYAFPPLSLIRPTLDRVRTQGLEVVLIAPAWGSWRSEISSLLYDQPWQLPLRKDLLTQAGFEIFHPCPQRLDLWAWPVRG